MKKIKFLFVGIIFGLWNNINSQTGNPNPAPYCPVSYGSGQCNQTGASNAPGNGINDFIHCFQTSGGNIDINNCNTGCNGNPNNYAFYCNHILGVSPGQTIVCSVQSGSTFAQGFAVFIDWNQDNIFNLPAEYMGGTVPFPPAATFTTFNVVIPSTVTPGSYRMRLRCSYVTNGNLIPPCGAQSFGETEDYIVYVGQIPANTGPVTATATVNGPICAGQALSFSCVSNYSAGMGYTWTGPSSYSSTNQFPTIFNASSSRTGIYTVTTSGACPDTKTVSAIVVAYPQFTVSPQTHTVCQGGNTVVSVFLPFGTNPSQYLYNWSPSFVMGVQQPFSSVTVIAPPLLPSTVALATNVYSITVTPTALGCAVTQTMALTINNPLTPTLTMPAPLCNIFSPVTLTAAPNGGTWSGNPAVSPSGIFNPALASIGINFVQYAISVGTCVVTNSDFISVSQFNTAALSGSLNLTCVQDPAINLMTLVQSSLTGIWSGGPFVTSGTTFNPGGLFSGMYNLTYNTFSTPVPSVCPHSTVLTVQVFNPPTPTISPIKPVCNTERTVALQVAPSGGLWTLNSGISAFGVQTPSLCLIGTNNVLYTAGIGTCLASSSATFHVSQFHSAALTGTVPNLCVNSFAFNLLSISQNTAFGTWTGPNITAAPAYSFSPGGLPTNTYNLVYTTVSSPNPNLCPDSRIIVASVFNPPTPTIMPIGAQCSIGAPVQLSVSPGTGYWTSSSYLSPSGVINPSLCAIGNNPVQYVIGNSTCNAQQTRTVSVELFIPATITNQMPDLCNTNGAVSLLPLTLSSLGNWTGPGVFGAIFDPGITGAGTFTLVHKTATSPSGLCPDQALLPVKVFSLATPYITQAGPFCNNAVPIKLQVSPVGGLFQGANNGAINLEGLFMPSFGNIGNNIVNYSIAAGPCIAFAQSTISVEKFVSANFETSEKLSFCQDQLPVNMESYVQNAGGLWSGPGIKAGSSMFTPKDANLGSNNIVVYKTFSQPNALLCPDTSAIRITVNETPTIALSANKYSHCAPFNVKFTIDVLGQNPAGNTALYIGDGSKPVNGNQASHTFTYQGTYTVLASFITLQGCSTQAIMPNPITVFESPKASFIYEPDEITTANPEVYLNNLSPNINNNTYQWNVTGLSKLYEINPKLTLPAIGLYKVTLTATSVDGCKDEMTKLIEMKNDFSVFIPNSFSPNADGVNDYFKPVFSPYGLDTQTYEMEIYDRWGHRIFVTKDFTKAWDGAAHTQSVNTSKQEAYQYSIKFKDLDGKAYFKTGTVTLLGN